MFQNGHAGVSRSGATLTRRASEQTSSCAPPADASRQISGATATRRAGKCHCSARSGAVIRCTDLCLPYPDGANPSLPGAPAQPRAPHHRQQSNFSTGRMLARRASVVCGASVFFARPLCAVLLCLGVTASSSPSLSASASRRWISRVALRSPSNTCVLTQKPQIHAGQFYRCSAETFRQHGCVRSPCRLCASHISLVPSPKPSVHCRHVPLLLLSMLYYVHAVRGLYLLSLFLSLSPPFLCRQLTGG